MNPVCGILRVLCASFEGWHASSLCCTHAVESEHPGTFFLLYFTVLSILFFFGFFGFLVLFFWFGFFLGHCLRERNHSSTSYMIIWKKQEIITILLHEPKARWLVGWLVGLGDGIWEFYEWERGKEASKQASLNYFYFHFHFFFYLFLPLVG